MSPRLGTTVPSLSPRISWENPAGDTAPSHSPFSSISLKHWGCSQSSGPDLSCPGFSVSALPLTSFLSLSFSVCGMGTMFSPSMGSWQGKCNRRAFKQSLLS